MLHPDQLLAQPPIVRHTPWTWRDVVLYHLGIGAGGDAPDLPWLFEDTLRVLPTFAVVPGMLPIETIVQTMPGFAIDPTQLVHERQHITLPNGPLPTDCPDAISSTRVTAVTDRRVGASVTITTDTAREDGTILATCAMTVFIGGEGGCGTHGEAPAGRPPRLREAAHQVDATTRTNQAALYRLSGDTNPLHIDPAFAAQAGFDQPILHGLCTLGIGVRVLCDTLLASDPTLITQVAGRFSGPVIPGDTLHVAMGALPEDVPAGMPAGMPAPDTSSASGTPVISDAARSTSPSSQGYEPAHPLAPERVVPFTMAVGDATVLKDASIHVASPAGTSGASTQPGASAQPGTSAQPAPSAGAQG